MIASTLGDPQVTFVSLGDEQLGLRPALQEVDSEVQRLRRTETKCRWWRGSSAALSGVALLPLGLDPLAGLGWGWRLGLFFFLVVVPVTLALFQNLLMPVPDLRIHRVVLSGSIVPRWTYWEHFIDESRVLAYPPINFVRPFDVTVRRGLHVGGGLSGTRGFSKMGRRVPVDHFKIGGHTSYDPDDFADIVKIIDGSYNPAVAVPEATFRASLSRRQRFQLWSYRRMGIA